MRNFKLNDSGPEYGILNLRGFRCFVKTHYLSTGKESK